MSTLVKSILPKSTEIGKAGELRVRSELLLQGFSPAVCDQDNGVDIILVENGKKLQIKTSYRPAHTPSSYSYKYSFGIRRAQFRNNNAGMYTKKFTKKSYEGVVDFFVFWLVEHDMFYIIPENIIGEKISIVVPTPVNDRKYRINDRKSKSKYEKYRDAWHLLV